MASSVLAKAQKFFRPEFVNRLDEMIVFNKDDFFDPIHTTPKGSKKIADSIYPQLYNY